MVIQDFESNTPFRDDPQPGWNDKQSDEREPITTSTWCPRNDFLARSPPRYILLQWLVDEPSDQILAEATIAIDEVKEGDLTYHYLSSRLLGELSTEKQSGTGRNGQTFRRSSADYRRLIVFPIRVSHVL